MIAPDVSVIMPVRNEERHIGEQLSALNHQTYKGTWELVVVDHDSTDRTIGIVHEWKGRLPAARVHVVDACSAAGVAEARNIGVAASSGDVVAFCDGDDVVSDTWLDELVAALDDHDVACGRLEPERLNPGWAPEALAFVHPMRQVTLVGGNFASKRAVYDAVGGMDPALLFGEDGDFGARVRAAGYDVCRLEGAIVHRRLPGTLRGLFKQRYHYGIGFVRFFERHGRRAFARRRAGSIAHDVGFLVLRSYWLLDRARRRQWVVVAGTTTGVLSAMLFRTGIARTGDG